MADSSASIIRDLLLTPDDVFNRETKSLDLQVLLELCTALQSEMRSEQGRFATWSSQLAKLDGSTDHASADFRRISSELTRSQNRLAQLLARSDHCLKLQRWNGTGDGDVDAPGNTRASLPKISGVRKSAPGTEAVVMAAAPAAHGVTSLKVKVTRKVVKPATSGAMEPIAVVAADRHSSRADGTHPGNEQPSEACNQIPPSFKITRKSSDRNQDRECSNTEWPACVGTAASSDDMKRQLAIASFQHLAATFASQSPAKSSSIARASIGSSAGSSDVASEDESSASKCDSSSEGAHAAYVTQTNVGAISRTTTVVTRRRVIKSTSELSTRPVSTGDTRVPSAGDHTVVDVVPDLSRAVPDGSDFTALSSRSLEDTVSTSRLAVKADGSTSSNESDYALLEHSGPADKADTLKHNGSVRSTEASGSQQLSGRSSDDGSVHAGDQLVQERVTVKDWNPVKLLSHLYAVRLAQETNSSEGATAVVNHCGYLEHLPIGKKKMTLLKTWRKSYFKAENGILYTYDSHDSESARSYLPLMDGRVENVGEKTLFIDNGRGLFAMMRCQDDGELSEWQHCLESQTRCSMQALYLRPVLTAVPGAALKIVIIDIGGCSVRAGIVGIQPSLPQLFFPAVAVKNPQTGSYLYGCDAYSPSNRRLGKLVRILGSNQDPSCSFNIEILSGLLKEVIRQLCIDVSEYTVVVSLPHSLGSSWREAMARLLLDQLCAAGACLVSQALLALYLYGLTSGVVVNVGDCVDIVAVAEGYLVNGPGGCARLSSVGGAQVEDDLGTHLTAYALYSSAEKLLVRYIKETTCYVTADARDDSRADDSGHQVTLDLTHFDLPAGRNVGNVTVGSGRFMSTEGLLRLERAVSAASLSADGRAGDVNDEASSARMSHSIARAILSCPVDVRRAAWRGVCLCGGTSLLPGLPERLQAELNALAPPGVVPQVHASVHRYHAAYIGACWLARLPGFSSICLTKAEWTAASVQSSTVAASRTSSAGQQSALLSTKWGGCFSA